MKKRENDNQTRGKRKALLYNIIADLKKNTPTESAAKEKYRILSMVLDQSHISIAILTREGIVEYANPKLISLYNLQPEKVIGKNWKSFLSKQSTLWEKYPEMRKNVIEKGMMWKGEISDQSVSGEIVWREVTIFPVKDEQGRLIYSVYMSEDITERKNTENLLKIQHDLSLAFAKAGDINAVLEVLLDAAFQMPGIDAGGVYLRNTKTGELDLIVHRGLSQEFLAVTSHYDGDSPQAQLVAKGNPIHQQFLKLGIDLDSNHKKEPIKAISIIPIKYKGEVIADLNLASHKYNELPISTRDTIEAIGGMVGGLIIRVRAELALRESEERYRQLINMIPDAILIIQEGKCRYINKAFTKIFGYDNQDIEAGLDFIKLVQDKDMAKVKQLYKNTLTKVISAIVEFYEIDAKAKDGSIIPCETSSVLIKFQDSAAFLICIRDIRERRKAEKEKSRLEERLRQSEKIQAIGELAGGIAHDFNNQLCGIMGYAEMLQEEVGSNKQLLDYVNNILITAQRATDLVTQLLAFARKGKYLSVPVDMHKTISEVISLLKHSIDKRIIIKKKPKTSCPFVMGDPSQLENAILNLALNARDAMPDGGDLIFATRVMELAEDDCRREFPEFNPGRYLEICVTDTGLGMDEETQKHIFEPFFTTKEQGKGVGMGLSAVYGTIKNHKGTIRVCSKLGSGSTFKIYLPLVCHAVTDKKHKVVKMEKSVSTAHILLIDDEEVVCSVASAMLTRSGYSVTVARDVSFALSEYKKNWQHIDMVILDMIMPKMNGREIFLKLKEINPRVLVLLSSGYSITHTTQQTLSLGARGFIQKPFHKAELLHKINDILY